MKLGDSKEERNAIRNFNQYIRLRDLQVNEYGEIYGYCFSCGAKWTVELFSDKSIMNGKKWHAGHYFKADQNASVRFDEDNVHLQCYHCNKNLSGNESNYEINLRKLLGEEGFEKLKYKRNQIRKYFQWEYKQIADKYRVKSKQEAKRLNINL